MVIIRSGAIASEIGPSGKCKIAAAPDNGRSNEPWQWRLTVDERPVAGAAAEGQSVTLHDPSSGEDTVLELAIERNSVSATMCTEVFKSQCELSRERSELMVVYMSSGELAFGNHTLHRGDAAILSGNEHFKMTAEPLTDEVSLALIRLRSLTETGLVWIP